MNLCVCVCVYTHDVRMKSMQSEEDKQIVPGAM